MSLINRVHAASFTVGVILVALLAHQPRFADAQNPQPTPRIYGAPDGLTGADCEGIMMRLDFIAIDARDLGKDQTIIIIGRQGSGERSRSLNRVRLKQIAEYLNRRIELNRIISAEGAPIKGLGQLEFYVGGKLHSIFKIRRNRDLVKGCN